MSSPGLPTQRPPSRSESRAYPKPNTSTMLSKIQYCMRQNTRAFLATVAFLAFVLVIASDYFHDFRQESANMVRKHIAVTAVNSYFGGAVNPGYFKPQDAIISDMKFHFAAVTDLDQLSRDTSTDKLQFRSIFTPAILTASQGMYSIDFDYDNARTLVTKHNEAGRGAEFSELTLYNNRLLTFDDRTGDVFEILNTANGKDSFCVPRMVITEGDGDTDKGMKWEWSTVKDNDLYMGSMGKEYTRPDGSIQNVNNLWIAIYSGATGQVRRVDWTETYAKVRQSLNAVAPGYLIIEAVNWSPYMKKWVFLPRRISSEAYDENNDEKMGGNKLVIMDEHFNNAKVVTIQFPTTEPLRGFSTFAFVPNTKDRHALAIRSVEDNCVGGDESLCKQHSYFCVFDVLTGKVLSEGGEVKYRDDMKFEGVEFVNIYTKP